jgi:hypothetical protein
MRPEIKRYLDQNGARYTSDALRSALLQVGHDPAEVDAALQEWESEHAGAYAGEESRRRFRRWTIWLHVGALAVVFVLLLISFGAQPSGAANAALVTGVLGILLLVGWYLSWLIGRRLLPRMGIAIALIIPLISALGLGGSCLALMGGISGGPQPQPGTAGSMKLHLEPPVSFDGAGGATCQGKPGVAGSSVSAGELGTLDGAIVSVTVELLPAEGAPDLPQPSGNGQAVNLSITLYGTKDGAAQRGWFVGPDTQISTDTSIDGSGNVAFRDLMPAETGDPAAPVGALPISGSVSWTCQGA